MRTETITRTIHTFDELSDDAKERAREWYRDGLGHNWDHENRDSLTAFCDVFPVRAVDWSYDQWTAYISPLFTGEDTLAALSGARLVAHLVNNYWKQLLTRPKVYCKGSRYAAGAKIRKSRINREFNDCPFTGYCFDENLLDDIRAYINKPDGRNYDELLSDCLHNWVSACRDDYAYQLTDESVDESILANEYEFSEDGIPA